MERHAGSDASPQAGASARPAIVFRPRLRAPGALRLHPAPVARPRRTRRRHNGQKDQHSDVQLLAAPIRSRVCAHDASADPTPAVSHPPQALQAHRNSEDAAPWRAAAIGRPLPPDRRESGGRVARPWHRREASWMPRSDDATAVSAAAIEPARRNVTTVSQRRGGRHRGRAGCNREAASLDDAIHRAVTAGLARIA